LHLRYTILLAFSFAIRDFKQRYVGTSLGQFWYILSPIITIFIYTVIFSDFMKMKMDIVDSTYAYSIYLVPGLLAWISFSSILTRLNTSFFDKAHLIKKIDIPMFVLSLSIAITEFFIFLVSMVFGVVFLILIDHPVTLTFLWLPLIMILQTLFAFSFGVIISLFTPFFKDLKEAVPIIVQLWFWMTPIIYIEELLKDSYPYLMLYNPFYYFVKIYQDIFLYSQLPSINSLITTTLITFISLVVAGFLYKKMISTIKDII
jgi:lipopolysaccharide transport system permease protein